MRRPSFIDRQSARPSGILGNLIARIMAKETSAINQRALELLSLRPNDRVLEVGFGHGRTLERVAAVLPKGHISGIDLSPSMTSMATRRNRRAIGNGRM